MKKKKQVRGLNWPLEVLSLGVEGESLELGMSNAAPG